MASFRLKGLCRSSWRSFHPRKVYTCRCPQRGSSSGLCPGAGPHADHQVQQHQRRQPTDQSWVHTKNSQEQLQGKRQATIHIRGQTSYLEHKFSLSRKQKQKLNDSQAHSQHRKELNTLGQAEIGLLRQSPRVWVEVPGGVRVINAYYKTEGAARRASVPREARDRGVVSGAVILAKE